MRGRLSVSRPDNPNRLSRPNRQARLPRPADSSPRACWRRCRSRDVHRKPVIRATSSARHGPTSTTTGATRATDILNRDLTNKTYKAGTHNCVVTSGRLVDPYTAAVIDFVRGQSTSPAVQIDHVVALSDAWQKGAQQLIADRRKQLANAPVQPLAVDGPSNQRKSDGDAATWLPANKSFRCSYVARQIGVKAKYSLWVTQAEHDAMSCCRPARPRPFRPATARNQWRRRRTCRKAAHRRTVHRANNPSRARWWSRPLRLTATVPMSTTRTAPRCVQPAKLRYTKGAARLLGQTRSRRRRRRLRIVPHLHPAKVPSAAAGMGLSPGDGFAAPPCPHCSRCFPYSDGIYYCVFGIGMRREGAGRKTPACGAEGEQSDGRASWSGQFRGRAAFGRECRVP